MQHSLKITRGQLRGRSIQLPPRVKGNLNLTPGLIKEALFQLLEGQLSTEISRYAFFDLCAGSGQMALEALSLGFSPVHMAEVDQERFRFLLKEVRRHGDPVELHKRDFRRMAPLILREPRSVVFLDPPYSFWNRFQCEAVDTLLFNLLEGVRLQREGELDEILFGGEGQGEILMVIQGPSPYEGLESLLERGDSAGVEIRREVRDYRKNHLTLLTLFFEKESPS